MSTKKNDERAKLAENISKRCETITLLDPVIIATKPIPNTPSTYPTPISFVLQTTQQAAQSFVGETTGVLIFGSATRPGGGWRGGAKAQEEDISLSSTWGVQAERAPFGFYKKEKGWGADAVLNAKGLWLVDEFGFDLQKPKMCSFISIACPNRKIPFVAKAPYSDLIKKLVPRIVTALNTWERQKIKKVVLGALGCGVFEWEPAYSAQAFKEAIPLSTYKGEICFAFIDQKIKDIFEKELSLSVEKNSSKAYKTRKR